MTLRTSNHRARLRSITTSFALLAAGVFVGVTSHQFVSADVSSGVRSVLVPIEPCRLADTRPAPNQVGPRAVPLGAGDVHTVDAQEAGTPCTGNIPIDATALSLNVTALGATELSYLTIWAGGERPLAASLNPAPGQPPVPNAVTTELSVDHEFEVYNNVGTVNVVIDVNGYYADHNHDDRYSRLDHDHDDRYPSVLGFTRRPPTFSTTYPFSEPPTMIFDLPSAGSLMLDVAVVTGPSGSTRTCNISQTSPTAIGDLTNRSLADGSGTHALVGAVDVAAAGTITLTIKCVVNGGGDGIINDYQMNAVFVPA